MKTIEQVMYHLTGRGVIEDLAEVMRENYPEFAAAEGKHHTAVATLRDLLPADMKPSLDEYLAAHERDIISRVAYAGYLGYRVNVENFHHPVMVDFVRLDTIDYIKDHMFGYSPQCREADSIHEAFRTALPLEHEDLLEDVDDYFVFMELTGPKLAHYAGYVIANQLLPWVEPGYREDWSQTMRFREETMKYHGYLPI